MEKSSKANSFMKPDKTRENILENKMKMHNIVHSQRENEIKKENSILFGKLMDISWGKRSNLPSVVSPSNNYYKDKAKLKNNASKRKIGGSNYRSSKNRTMHPSPTKARLPQSPVNFFAQPKIENDEIFSLNYNKRKRETERIERENLKLAEKLITTESNLKKNIFLSDFKKFQKYK